ncbi:MAG: HU family DNA-binding protein [Bacteroides sp.]|nr:HU family DNA-binding protein [Bacteroides sp.]
MPVIYKPQQSSLANKEGVKLFYPRVLLTGNVSTDQIAKEIAELSSLTSGDVKNVIDNLVTVMTRHLQASQSVTLDGFGSFRYTIKNGGHGAATADEVSTANASIRVRFLPVGQKQSGVVTRGMTSGVQFVRFDTAATVSSDNASGDNSSTEDDENLYG